MINKKLTIVADFLEGALLAFIGSYLLLIYYLAQSKSSPTWDTYVFLSIAIGAVVLGLRRIAVTIKKKLYRDKNQNNVI